MNFDLNDEQKALRDSLQRFLGDNYSFEKRRALAATDKGWSPEIWRQLSELGVCGLLVAEEAGGFDGRSEDVLPVMQQLGAALALEPYLASAVLAATALRNIPPSEATEELLQGIASGALIVAWAHDEPGNRYLGHAPEATRARLDGDRWLLTGTKCNVLHGGSASHFVISAGLTTAAATPALFLVEACDPGVQCAIYRFIDDSPAADLVLANASAQPLCLDLETAGAAVRATLAAGTAAACADAVGAMDAAFRLATDYAQSRQQFGRTIGANQAVRHRLAEMFVSLEISRSMAINAAIAADDPSSPASATDLMRAKLIVGKHARAVCQGAVQLHGGIGMAQEYAVGHYLRRVTLLDQLFGDADSHAASLGDLLAQSAG